MNRAAPVIMLCLLAAFGAGAETLRARDFGAVPGDKKDDGPALRRCVARAAETAGPVEILLERGVYRLGSGPEHDSAVVVRGAKGLTLRGAGQDTLLLLTDPRQGGFFVAESERVWFEDLAVDHDPVPFTQGRVLWVDRAAGWFALALQEGYPNLDEPWFADAPKPYGQWGMIYDAKRPELKAGAPDFVFMDGWEPVTGRVWRMRPVADQKNRLEQMRSGDRFVHMARHGRGGAFFFWRSRECGVRRVSVHASQSLAVGAVGADALTVDRMIVAPRPGTDRLLSTNSDGVHCQQNLRGPRVTGCHFEGMADDGVNIYYPPNRVETVVSETVLRVSGGGSIEPGDVVQVFDPVNGRIRGESRVASVRAGGEAGTLRVSLESRIPDMIAGPDFSTADSVYNLSRCGAGFEITGNVFFNHRRHGMMIKATDGLVERNFMDRLGALGIVAGNDPAWPEGVAPRGVVIRHNTVRDCGRSMWYGADPRGAAIQIAGRAVSGLAAGRLLRGITVVDNQCVNPPGAALYIGAAEGVTVSGLAVWCEPDWTAPRPCAAVVVENTGGLNLSDVRLESANPEMDAVVRLEASVGAGEGGAVLRRVETTAPLGVKLVDDRRAK